MLLEDYLDFVGPDQIRIKGHRIGIEHVLEYYRDGFSPEQIAQELRGLTLEEIHATITYYWHNQADVDSYLKRLEALCEAEYQESSANPSPLIQRLRAIRAQRENKEQRSA